MKSPKLTADHLRRQAVVYVRQSTQNQVVGNLESQRRQYGLVELAEEMGFSSVVVIDDDQGRSGSGKVDRPGFDRLFSELATRKVGAVFCLEASRLARNGSEWHMLLDMCAVVEALIAGPEGVYDPRNGDDRLLLGLKGSVSEYELTMLRRRAQGAIEAKAARGELRCSLAVGLSWTRDGRIELNPDLRVQEAIRLIFRKYAELGSTRQVMLWFRREQVTVPVRWWKTDNQTEWKLPKSHTIGRVVTSPFYAGAYAWGRKTGHSGNGQTDTSIYAPHNEWRVLLLDHHPGYISWDEHLRIRRTMAENTHRLSEGRRKAGRGGGALLSGLLRCFRCGRRLNAAYTGNNTPRYMCPGESRTGGKRCIAFSGVSVDEAISREILRAVEGPAVEAAVAAADAVRKQKLEVTQVLENELEQAQYRARLAQRRYDQTDPDNRLVAAQLERRWNEALLEVEAVERRLNAKRAAITNEPTIDREVLLRLASNLPEVWHDDRTNMRAKQRIVHVLIEEILVDVDLQQGRVNIVIHWVGGRHSTTWAKRRRKGQHSLTTSTEIVEIVRQMAAYWDGTVIASTLNRLGLKTAKGLNWTAGRVSSLRRSRGLTDAVVALEADNEPAVTLSEAAKRLGTSTMTVRNLIKKGILRGDQIVPYAPWRIPIAALGEAEVLQAVAATKSRVKGPRTRNEQDWNLRITEVWEG